MKPAAAASCQTGRPKILIERHWFSRLTQGQFNVQAPDISNATSGGYGAGGAFQYERLAKVIAMNRTAALKSTSWGLGQVMGFNAAKLGFANVNASGRIDDVSLERMANNLGWSHAED